MEAMKSYFEYVAVSAVCGIPEITLQGTPDDWQKVLDKTRLLAKYDLAWWTKELEPILKEFIKASNGKVNKLFWRKMFKYHSSKEYGAPNIVDGWIVKFFPYDKDGNRKNLKEITDGASLPNEIVKVDMQYVDIEAKTTTPLELWAGFIGLEQNNENYALTPRIGWMIRKADASNAAMKQGLKSSMGPEGEFSGSIIIRVREIPPEILKLKKVDVLHISFIDKIVIPDGLAKVDIGYALILYGKIDEAETKRIKAMFSNTRVYINGKLVSERAD